jgi:streptogramin lyase
MALHPDEAVWATGAGRAPAVPEAVQFKFYEHQPAKTIAIPALGIAVAGDGTVWFAEDEADQMARVDPKTGKATSSRFLQPGHAFPRRMNSDANGDLWVALWKAGKLMKVDYKTNAMSIFSPPTPNGGSYSVVVDKKNNYIWVSQHQVDMIARFDPKTSEWIEFALPEAESDPRRIDIDPTNPNRIFFSGNIPGRVGFIEVLPQ